MGYKIGLGGGIGAQSPAPSARTSLKGSPLVAQAQEDNRFMTSYKATFSRAGGLKSTGVARSASQGALLDPSRSLRAAAVGAGVAPSSGAGTPTRTPLGSSRLGSAGPASPIAARVPLTPTGSQMLAVEAPALSKSFSEASLVKSPQRQKKKPPPRVGPTAKKVDRETRRKTLELLANPDLATISQDIFKAHDNTHDGKLGLDELLNIMQTLHRELDLLAPDQVVAESLFKKYDVNNDNTLGFKEFFDLFKAQLRRSAFDRSSLLSREFFITENKGDVWKSYTRQKELGAGSFGTCYLAKKKGTQDEVVVKAVKKSRTSMPLDDIEQEIMIMRQVDHPHVVRLYEWYEDASKIYLVLEALKGGTLKDVVLKLNNQNKGLREAWIRKVTMQCCEGMAYCHQLRLIHKDIKDENIMLLKKDEDFANPFVVLIDLGIAEMFSVADPAGRMMGGTPMTMAPEVWMGNFGPKCDVWSLGCVLYEVLSGSFPFMATSMNPQAWLRLHKRGPDWSKIKSSTQGKALCKRMLQYKDADRPTMRECGDDEWFTMNERELSLIPPAQFAPFAALCHQQGVKRKLLLEIASRLPMDQASMIVEMFESLDTDNDGLLSPKELRKLFAKMGLEDPELCDRTFKALDADSDGSLTFTEFAAGALVLFKDKLEDSLMQLFKKYDPNNDGTLDRSEAKSFLQGSMRAMGLEEGQQSSPDEYVEKIMQGSASNTISFDQLRQYMLGGNSCATTPASTARSSRRGM